MKICAIIENMHQGGAEHMLARLLNKMSYFGHEVFLITFGHDFFYDLDSNIVLFTLASEQKKFGFLTRFFKKRKNVFKLLKDINPDVIFGIYFWPLIYVLSPFLKIPIIASERSNPLLKKSIKERICKKIVFNKAKRVIFQTESAKNCFNNSIKKKGIVIPNFVDDYFYSLNYSIPKKNNSYKICSVGSIKKEKDYFTLLKAFKILQKEKQIYELHIYGKDYLNGSLKVFVEENGIRNVFIHEPVKDVWNHLLDSSCYVLSSVSEGMPNSLMEAMTIGIPSISTNCNFGPSELIVNNYNGILVPTGDYLSIATAVIRICSDYSFSNNISKQSKKTMESFKCDSIFSKYLSVFIDVCGDGNKSV